MNETIPVMNDQPTQIDMVVVGRPPAPESAPVANDGKRGEFVHVTPFEFGYELGRA